MMKKSRVSANCMNVRLINKDEFSRYQIGSLNTGRGSKVLDVIK